jgi:hypothetical protein
MAKEICAKLPSLREGCSNRSDMLHAKDCSIAGASLSPLSKFSCSDRSRFGHLQPDRKAAIRSDSRDCQSFHTESLQSYAELVEVDWSFARDRQNKDAVERLCTDMGCSEPVARQ